MIAPRLALIASLMLVAGCGSTTPEVDTAETIRKEAPKDSATPAPAPAPAATPEAPAVKDAPKG